MPTTAPKHSPTARLRRRIDRVVRKNPLRRHRTEGYARWFPRSATVFLRMLESSTVLHVPDEPVGATAVVVVMPWVSTAAPWYAVLLALGLARRGRRTVIVWDDLGFPEDRIEQQQREIGRVLAVVGRSLPMIRLSGQSARPVRDTDAEELTRLAEANVTWMCRAAPRSARSAALETDVAAALARTLARVRGALDEIDPEYLVVPGGVYGTSGLYPLVARERRCRAATFDADRQVAQVCTDGIAAQSSDVPRAFEALWNATDAVKQAAIAAAREEFRRRADARDPYGFQAVADDAAGGASGGAGAARSGGGLVIPLNVEWDTAALGKHRHFADTAEWLITTIGTALDTACDSVTVRQHPVERRAAQASRSDVEQALHHRFGHDPRYRFVGADQPVNTYDLVRGARLVAPFVSTIGIESAAIGRPVLVAGSAFYADLGFVWSAGSRDEYLDLLRRGLADDLGTLPDQSDRAWLCYYLATVCYRVPTGFTPQPDDFWRWSRRTPESILAEPNVAVLLEAIDDNVPVALLQHEAMVANATAPSVEPAG